VKQKTDRNKKANALYMGKPPLKNYRASIILPLKQKYFSAQDKDSFF